MMTDHEALPRLLGYASHLEECATVLDPFGDHVVCDCGLVELLGEYGWEETDMDAKYFEIAVERGMV